MAKITTNPFMGLNYSDLGTIPTLGRVQSRNEIKMLGYKIIISPVSSIVSKELIKEMTEIPQEMRPSIAIPRTEDALEYLEYAVSLGLAPWVIPCISVKGNPDIEDYIIKMGCFDKILVDIAFGGLPQLKGLGYKLHNKFGDNVKLICGSASTEEIAAYLANQGFDIIRSGVGTSSSLCSTAFKTSIRVGAASELINIHNYTEGTEIEILADGGMLYNGDICKAFLLHADYVMGATIFSDLKNAKLNLDGSGKLVGMSNKKVGCRAGKTKYDESFVVPVNIKKDNLVSLYEKLEDIWGSIRSCLSYSGFASLEEAIKEGGEFCILKQPLKRVVTEINK